MNTSCNHCGFIGPSVTHLNETRCARCGMQFIEALPKAPTVPTASPSTSEGLTSCVKCLHEQLKGSFACEKCGLRFALAAKLPSNHSFDGLPDTPTATALKQHWVAISSIPHDEAKHFKFIDLCQVSGHIDFAGHCYRIAAHNSNGQEMKHWLSYQQRVLQRAMLNLGTPSASSQEGSRLFPLFMMVLGALVIFGLAYLYYHWSQSSAAILQNGL